MNDDLDLGACCACEGTKDVFNIIQLHFKAPVPGTGWGCEVCGLPMDGALAVKCDRCQTLGVELRFAVYGYISNKQRIKIDELTGDHKHHMHIHEFLEDAITDEPDRFQDYEEN